MVFKVCLETAYVRISQEVCKKIHIPELHPSPTKSESLPRCLGICIFITNHHPPSALQCVLKFENYQIQNCNFTYRENPRENIQANARYHGISCKRKLEVLGQQEGDGNFPGREGLVREGILAKEKC